MGRLWKLAKSGIAACVFVLAIAGHTSAAWQPDGTRVSGLRGQLPGQVIRLASGDFRVMSSDVSRYTLPPDYTYDCRVLALNLQGEVPPAWPDTGTVISLGPQVQTGQGMVENRDGSISVAFTDYRNITRTFSDLWLSRIGASGLPAPGWPSGGIPISELPQTQASAHICRDEGNGNLIAWEDTRPGSDGANVYMQRVDEHGALAPGWIPDGLPVTLAPGDQWIEGMVSDSAGGALLVWTDFRLGGDVVVQRMSGSGAIAKGWPALGVTACDAPGVQTLTAIAPDGAGGAYVAWSDARTGVGLPFPEYEFHYDIYAQHVLGDGTIAPGWPEDGLLVAEADWIQWNVRVVADGVGGAYVVWEDFRTNGAGIRAQRLRGDGTRWPGWPSEGLRLIDQPGYQSDFSAVSDERGGLYVASEIELPSEPSPKTVVQHVSGAGAFDAWWSGGGYRVARTIRGQQHPVLAADGEGGAIVAWTDSRAGLDAYAQRIFPDGPVATEVSLASSVASAERVELWWQGARAGELLAVERRVEGEAWVERARVSADGTGEVRYGDTAITPGGRYGYRLRTPAGRVVSAETSVEVPRGLVFALEGARPNPSPRRAVRVSLTLAERGAVRLALHDVSGRRVLEQEPGELSAGRHVLSLPGAAALSPGLYWLTLEQHGRRASTRVVLAE